MIDDYPGLFVVFEGGEGSGKSTQAKALAESLRNRRIDYLLTHEPGDSVLGYELRQLLLDPNRDPISKKAEALLFAADRAEHVEKVIVPALMEGRVVICDRYIASTIAYQSYGNGLDMQKIQSVSDWASDDLYPDITFFLDIDPEIGLARVTKRGKKTRIDDRGLGYHRFVRRGFIMQINNSWITLDAQDTIHELHQQAFNCVIGRLADKKTEREQIKKIEQSMPPPMQKTFACPKCDAALVVVLGQQQYSCPNGHGYMWFGGKPNATSHS